MSEPTRKAASTAGQSRDGMTMYGFQWGPIEVTRMAHIDGRGRVIGIDTPHHRCQLYVSEAGRSIRLWIDGEEVGS